MLRPAGSAFERNFDALFKGRSACMTMRVSSVTASRLEFSTGTWWKPSSTVFVVEASRQELTRYRKGDKLKVEGTLSRFKRTPASQPDEIYISGPRFSKVE